MEYSTGGIMSAAGLQTSVSDMDVLLSATETRLGGTGDEDDMDTGDEESGGDGAFKLLVTGIS